VKRLLLALVALAVVAGAWLYLRPGAGRERRTNRAVPEADPAAAPPRAAAETETEADAAASEWQLTVRFPGGTHQPAAARICVVSPGGEVLQRKDVKPGGSLEAVVRGIVRVVGYPQGERVHATVVHDRVAPPASGQRVLDLVFSTGLVIAGTIVDQNGAVITGKCFQVEAKPVELPWWIRPSAVPEHTGDDLGGGTLAFATRSDKAGRFELGGLDPGRYQLKARTYLESWVIRCEAVEVEAGDRNVSLVGQRKVEFHLSFVDAQTGSPVQTEIRYRASLEEGRWWSQVGRGHLGRRGVNLELEPGTRFHLEVEAEGYVEPRPLIVDANREPGPQELTIELEPDAGVYARLTLAVTDDAGHAVEPLMIERASATGRRHSRSGRYTLRAPAGVHEIELRSPSDQVLLYRREWYPKGVDDERPEVERVWLPKTITVELERGANVTRQVEMQRAGLIWVREKPDVEVRLLRVCRDGETVTDDLYALYGEKGRVAVVAPGTYTVRAVCDDMPCEVSVAVAAEKVVEVELPPDG
jgi:hypothetical protein